MEPHNQTAISQFLLLGLSDDSALKPVIFSLFLSMYMVTILGNLLIILMVSSDSHLHTPMYFFHCNLSFNDICLSTCTIPRMLVNLQTQDQRITYTGCLSQVCFIVFFAFVENFLLAVMAYDCYVAICHPLNYTVIMNPCLCVLLVLFCILINLLIALLHTLMLLWLSCTELEIPHFCELAQAIELSCSDSFIDNILIYVSSCIFGGLPLSGIIFSYVHIMSSA
ncbi:Olfactory receptor 7G2 [Sciurus carolinensis]|uniref:Olfactory receptor 7G2 n=1 Tax=Sciurus carolinensis TaxID=30640 RepID=A0AA41MM34_SCICA|nr:Olfactory receptor 7G2 [Sciurus carolinensis]